MATSSFTHVTTKPMVSVIIPTYNCATFLDATLTSVMIQTYTDFEVIVVDDGSTDQTQQVLLPYLNRIVSIIQSNQGLPSARNAGIRAARGDFIALLDADDSWTMDKLEQQMPRFADPEVGIVSSDFSVQYADGTFRKSYLVDRPLAGEGLVFDRYIQSRFLFPSAMIIRRACFDQCGLFDECMLACEDIELFGRMCLRWKVALVRRSLMIRFEGSHNITANQLKMNSYTIRALRQILIKEPQLTTISCATVERELAQQYWWFGYAAFGRLDLTVARHALLNACYYDRARVWTCGALIALSLLPEGAIRYLHRAHLLRKARSKDTLQS